MFNVNHSVILISNYLYVNELFDQSALIQDLLVIGLRHVVYLALSEIGQSVLISF